MAQAFRGIRVIDFTQVLAGPFATLQLALLGADVIKVEQPETGDQTRDFGGESGGDTGMSSTFLTCNGAKRSLTLNLKHEAAARVVEKLIGGADVVVENFRPGVMARLGFDYETFRSIKPDLIYCSISGYGQSGPRSEVAAYDGAVQADSGMMSITGSEASGPLRTGYMPVDMATALNAAFAISAALFRRSATGEGQRLDVAMMDTAVVMQAVQYAKYLDSGELPALLGNRSPTGQPTANVFATSDGHLQILALKDAQVERLFTALECIDQLREPAFTTQAARKLHYDEVRGFLSEVLKSRTTETWFEALIAAGVPVSKIRNFDTVRADPQFEQRNVFLDSPAGPDHPTATVIGTGYVAAPDGPSLTQPPPRLGAHTEQVLAELGYDGAEISALRAAGAI